MTIKIPIKTTKQYVTMVSGVVRLSGQVLTDTEIDVLSAFIDLHLTRADRQTPSNLFSPEMKRLVAASLGRPDFNTLNNFLKSLCDKKALTRVEGGYEIMRLFIPDSTPLTIEYNSGN